MSAKNIGIIILAAGSSSRLGKAKQLVKFQNTTLISNTVKSAINSRCSQTVVVLGSNADKIKREIKDFQVEICINEQWQSGMASSIKCGLDNLLKSELDAVIIMLCDQPLIKTKHINLLLKTFKQTNKEIIAAEYKNTVGVPALFSKEIFAHLLQLKGDKGARQIINRFPKLLAKVPLPEAGFDVDTSNDYQKLKEHE